ncbi:MAG: helix-turn-helix domain-containing protein [Lachnospiraceae bacterium]
MNINRMVIGSNQEEKIEHFSTNYPYVMHTADLKKMLVPWHWHEEVEFDYVLSGKMNVTTIERTYEFQEGEAFFINTNVLCSMESASGKITENRMYSHLFHPVFLGGYYKSIFETKYINPVLQNRKLDIVEIKGRTQNERELLKKLYQVSLLQEKSNMEFQTRNAFSEIWLLLMEIIRDMPKAEREINIRNQSRMQTMLSFIHQNYAEKITLEEIASSAVISRREAIRCFQNSIQKAPIEYLMEYRMERAKEMLEETDESITEVGMRCGFSSNAYFGKVFKEHCGITPLEYRRMQQET